MSRDGDGDAGASASADASASMSASTSRSANLALGERYLADVAGAPDQAARRAGIDRLLAPDVTYIDDDGDVTGIEAVDARMRDLAAPLPEGTTVQAGRPAQTVADLVLVHWRLTMPGQPSTVSGTDVLSVESGRITRIATVLED